ncbi:MAG: hypothetical protein V3T72_15945 [Thermoanaerobaculia bacterium]
MNRFVVSMVAAALSAGSAAASEVKIFRTETREAVLEGAFEGVSVDSLGALELAVRLERLAVLEEPYVFAAAGSREGWVVGTGNSGKVLRIDADGEITELAAVDKPEIFAVHADADGTVLFASSPDGKVYRVSEGGEAEPIFDPGEKYVWDLARDREGRLLVATGLVGRVYRVAADGSGDPEILLESRDSHVRTLAVLPDGSILAGSAGQGLIQKISPGGKVETLYDAAHPEVLTFAAAPGGVVYAALLASEASQVDLSAQRQSNDDSKDESKDEAVVVTTAGDTTVGSRSAGFKGPRSVVLEIAVDGRVEEVVELQDETVHSLLWHDGALWIGTGQEGRLYRFADRQLIQERKLEQQQLIALAAGGAGIAVVTTNGAAVYRLDDDREARGTYTSKVLDASQVARFGSFLWEGDLPKGGGVELAFRSGMSSQPDATWTEWDCPGCGGKPCFDGEPGCPGRRRSVALGELARGRYVQWRAVLGNGGGKTPRLEASELSYRQENLRPKVEKLEVLDPGQILVPQNFNPTNQTFEPWSPNREGIFTTLRPESGNGDGRLKTLWKKGYRTLRWTTADANEDELVYRLEFRLDEAGSEAGSSWLQVADKLDEDYYSFDATVLPDGVYRFRLTASDRPGHSAGEALTADKLSEPVVVDNSPPLLESLRRRDGVLEVVVRDVLSPMREAAVSVDAGEWRPIDPADGLLDGRRETLGVAVPEGARMVLLRLTDAHFNVVTLDLLEKK